MSLSFHVIVTKNILFTYTNKKAEILYPEIEYFGFPVAV